VQSRDRLRRTATAHQPISNPICAHSSSANRSPPACLPLCPHRQRSKIKKTRTHLRLISPLPRERRRRLWLTRNRMFATPKKEIGKRRGGGGGGGTTKGGVVSSILWEFGLRLVALTEVLKRFNITSHQLKGFPVIGTTRKRWLQTKLLPLFEKVVGLPPAPIQTQPLSRT
jgi:hypothetical protein